MSQRAVAQDIVPTLVKILLRVLTGAQIGQQQLALPCAQEMPDVIVVVVFVIVSALCKPLPSWFFHIIHWAQGSRAQELVISSFMVSWPPYCISHRIVLSLVSHLWQASSSNVLADA